jgi:regulator of protease activity HflC (stomatin/prohibitin superfamily)
MFFETRIGQQEFGLLFRHGDFVRVLAPGRYRFFGRLLGQIQVEVYDRESGAFDHGLIEILLGDETFRGLVDVYEIADDERGIVLVGGVVDQALLPGRYVFTKGVRERELIRFVADGELVDHPKIEALLQSQANFLFQVMEVPARQVGLLFRNGADMKRLDSGRYVVLRDGNNYDLKLVDLREQFLEIAGQEILTADRVSLRLTAQADYRVVDVERSLAEVTEVKSAIYRAVQIALRAAVGERKLDELLGDKVALSVELEDAVKPRVEVHGVELTALAVRDIILPGDMKALLNQVVEAEKDAEANFIRRREETAATRSQLNTARLLADNPALLRMRELEELRKILLGVDAKFVFADGNLLDNLRGLVRVGDDS